MLNRKFLAAVAGLLLLSGIVVLVIAIQSDHQTPRSQSPTAVPAPTIAHAGDGEPGRLPGSDALRCGDDKYRMQHTACFDQELARVPNDQRETVRDQLAKFHQLLVELDRLDKERIERNVRVEQLVLDGIRHADNDRIRLGEVADKVLLFCGTHHGEPQIGMSEDEVLETSWCFPVSITETVTASHLQRQLVYHREMAGRPWGNGHEGILHFDNGHLITIQR